MKAKRAAFLLPWLAILCTMSSGAGATGPQIDTEPIQPQIEKREYVSEDGRNIVITALGNLIRFESPRGFEHVAGGPDLPLDGYVLSYREPGTGTVRVLHNVYRSQSSTIKPGLPDFVPISFQGPPSNTVFPRGKVVRATVIVGTQDGLLQVRTTYSWMEAMVSMDTLVTAVVRPVRVISVKRLIHYTPDGSGPYGLLGNKFDVLTVEQPPPMPQSVDVPSVIIQGALCCSPRCGCPPPLPAFSQLSANSHIAHYQAWPAGAALDALMPTVGAAPNALMPYLTVADTKDPCELLNSGKCQGSPLPRLEQDSLVTSGWLVNRTLGKNKSIRFLTRTTIF